MRRPYVIINCASSLDGRIGLADRRPLKISNEEDMERVHKLRNECDAILVGIGTVLADNPKLTVKKKYVENAKNPLRVILDSHFSTPEDAEVMRGNAKTLIVTTSTEFRKGNVEVIKCGDGERVDLEKLMGILYERGIKKLMVEGGSEVIGEFLKKGLVDEMLIFYAPIFVGEGAPSIFGIKGSGIEDIIRMKIRDIRRLGDGYLLHLIPERKL